MKKIFFIFLFILLVVSSAFAAYPERRSVGPMVNWCTMGILGDYEMDNFGFEGYIGFPVLSGLSAYQAGENFFSAFLIPAVMGNAYVKLFEGKAVELRLGLQTDAVGFIDDDQFNFFGLVGLSFGFDCKFSPDFGFNFTAGLPLAIPLYEIWGEDVLDYTVFAYFSGKNELKDVVLGILSGAFASAFNQFGRFSLKWTF